MSVRPTPEQDRAELARLRKEHGTEKMRHLTVRGGIFHLVLAGPDGKDFTRSTGTRDVRKAWKMRDEATADIRSAKGGKVRWTPPSADRETVRSLKEALVAHFEARRIRSLREVKAHLKPIIRLLGAKRALAITPAVIDGYVVQRRAEKAADATIDRELELLRRSFTLARDNGVLSHVPRVSRLVKGHSNARQGFVERSELEAFLPALPSQWLRDIAMFAYVTAMRCGEILSLTWDEWDAATKTVRLHAAHAKTAKARAIPLADVPEAATVMERRVAERRLDCPLIFHNGQGRRVGDFYTTWVRALKRAKLRHFTIHDFRRTAVRNMVRAEVSESVAMAISGHRTRAMFDRYNITSERDIAEAMLKRAAYESAQPKAAVQAGEVVAFRAEASNPASKR